ncbi:MAG TPA: fused MFS/spermidine synthase [Candidatus Acidoferrales bacterium]
MIWLYVLFFISGFPALIYQIVWQRALFAIYGINVESVTVVVSAFMLGLGVGSLLGGYISEKPGVPLLAIFGFAELGVSAYGISSLHLFHRVANMTGGLSTVQTGLIAFVLVVIPTALMGATLPLLVEHVVRVSGNVGRSVGVLYFVNTLGSATACIVAGKVSMRHLGMSASVVSAAAINATIGITVLAYHVRRGRTSTGKPAFDEIGQRLQLIPFWVGIVVAGIAGFISLSYEIVWYRLYSFVSAGSAKSFAYVLGFFLAGIAFGSLLARLLCRDQVRQNRDRYLRTIAGLVIIANVLGYLLVPIVAHLVLYVKYQLTLPLVAVTAGLMGATFPLVSHICVKPDQRAGARLSYLYVSNIVGSVLGSLLVGFVLMDAFGIRQISVLLALFGVSLGFALWISGKPSPAQRNLGIGVTAAAAVLIALASGPLFDTVYARLQYKDLYQPGARFAHIVENKSGVITVDPAGTIYGGGIYDGAFNTDLVNDRNYVFRAFAISAFHPAPREILEIGLSSGSWAQVLANHPEVEKLTIVEINPGYLELIPKYSNVAELLHNPKVEIVIDDGRRWLVRNPRRKFDVILNNTSFNWREHTTNLLSVEFLELIRRHLKPGGVYYYNTTDSERALRTGAAVFPYVLRVANFEAVSDSPLNLDAERWRQTLTSYRIDGKPVFDLRLPRDQERMEELVSYVKTAEHPTVEGQDPRPMMENGDSIRRRTAGSRVITDDNMGTEWTPPGHIPGNALPSVPSQAAPQR